MTPPKDLWLVPPEKAAAIVNMLADGTITRATARLLQEVYTLVGLIKRGDISYADAERHLERKYG